MMRKHLKDKHHTKQFAISGAKQKKILEAASTNLAEVEVVAPVDEPAVVESVAPTADVGDVTTTPLVDDDSADESAVVESVEPITDVEDVTTTPLVEDDSANEPPVVDDVTTTPVGEDDSSDEPAVVEQSQLEEDSRLEVVEEPRTSGITDKLDKCSDVSPAKTVGKGWELETS